MNMFSMMSMKSGTMTVMGLNSACAGDQAQAHDERGHVQHCL